VPTQPGALSDIPGPSLRPLSIDNPHDSSVSVGLSRYTLPSAPYVFRATATNPSGLVGVCQSVVAVGETDERRFGLFMRTKTADELGDGNLHLLRQLAGEDPWSTGGWFNWVNDCFFGTNLLDWGHPGGTVDNPVHRTISMNEETVTLPRPPDGGYRVGVHRRTPLLGGTTRVEVLCEGVLRAEWSRRLQPQEFWEVATVDFPGCLLTPIHETRIVNR
jgi:hypothetical protein